MSVTRCPQQQTRCGGQRVLFLPKFCCDDSDTPCRQTRHGVSVVVIVYSVVKKKLQHPERLPNFILGDTGGEQLFKNILIGLFV